MFPDVHRELHRVNVMGDVVAIELAIQGTFRGPMETPAGVILVNDNYSSPLTTIKIPQRRLGCEPQWR